MFNRKKQAEERAHGTVLEVEQTRRGASPGYEDGPNVRLGGTFRVRARIEPSGRPAFEATFKLKTETLTLIPRVDEPIAVLFDPEDPEGSVVWDEQTAHDDRGKQVVADGFTLKPSEQERFLRTVLAKIDEEHAAGRLTDAERAAKIAEVEANLNAS
jgi:hypothetical protein